MNKTILAILALVMVIASAGLVAADVTMTSDVDTVDYEEFTDDEEEYIFEATFTFSNSNSSSNESFDATVSLASSVSDYITVSDATEAVALEGSTSTAVTFEFTIDVTKGFDSGTYTDALTVSWTDSTGSNSQSADLEVETMLEIEKAYLHIDDDEDETMDDGDADDDSVDFTVKPGDEIDIYFNLVNRFDNDFREGDITVDVTAEMDDSDFEDDIDEDFDVDIDAGEEIDDGDKEYSISFDVPLEAEAKDDYELIVTFEAEDEYGAQYNDEWIIVIEVEREDDDVQIDSVSFAQTPICGESPRLTVKVTNYGEDSQDDMYVHVFQSDLDISETQTFDIEEGMDKDDNQQTLSYYLEMPEDAKEKSYQLEATLYYEDSDTSDRELLSFDLTCLDEEATTSSSDDEEESTTQVILLGSNGEEVSETAKEAVQEAVANTQADANADRVVTVEKSYTIKDTQLGLTIVLIVLVVLALIALLIVGLRRK